MSNIEQIQRDLMEKKAREMVDTFFSEIRYESWERAKTMAVLSLLSSMEWVKSVRAYYKDTKDIVDTIERMIGVVRNLQPLDYGDKPNFQTIKPLQK